MNVLLIQPPDPPLPMLPFEPPSGTSRMFSPPWNLLCLRAYLLERTRHGGSFLDCRFFDDLEAGLTEAIRTTPDLGAAVVNTATLALGQAAAVVEIIKRSFPAVKTVLCGQHPSQFPDHVGAMPRVDFSLAGDPEPILRNLLDCLDVEARLRRVPGLVRSGGDPVAPYWLTDLKALSLPDWQGVFWGGYRVGSAGSVCRASVRLSRGHTHVPADRAFGENHEPLRFWPLDRMASVIQRCTGMGVSEVFLADPPGIWTPERLDQWCALLDTNRNAVPWSLQLLPTLLGDDTVGAMQAAGCRRVEFLFPSCDPEVLERYGCVVRPRDVADTLASLRASGIGAHARFWIGGPEERHGAADRTARTIRALGFPPFSLHPFPLALDSPIYQDYFESSATHLDQWVQWSRDPWMFERPVSLWGGSSDAPLIEQEFDTIVRAVQRSPSRLVHRALDHLKLKPVLSAMEEKVLSVVAPRLRK